MDKTSLYVNSRNQTANAFTITLNPSVKVNGVSYVGGEFPFSFYATNATNNQLQFRVGATTYTATIAPGNYEIPTYVSTLQTAMNSVFAGFTVTHSRVTQRVTISNATAFTILATSSCRRQLGITVDATGATYVSNVIDVSGPRYLLVRSNALTGQKIIRTYLNSDLSNVVAKISITGAPGDIIVDRSIHNCVYRTPQTLQTIDFIITDEYGTLVDFNGLDVSMSFVLN